jgi:hypothetical protein
MPAIGQSHSVIQGTDSECFRSSEATSVGAPEGIRTPNLLIRSQMLYPLSYGRGSSP